MSTKDGNARGGGGGKQEEKEEDGLTMLTYEGQSTLKLNSNNF